jgi:hypothetical protein
MTDDLGSAVNKLSRALKPLDIYMRTLSRAGVSLESYFERETINHNVLNPNRKISRQRIKYLRMRLFKRNFLVAQRVILNSFSNE